MLKIVKSRPGLVFVPILMNRGLPPPSPLYGPARLPMMKWTCSCRARCAVAARIGLIQVRFGGVSNAARLAGFADY